MGAGNGLADRLRLCDALVGEACSAASRVGMVRNASNMPDSILRRCRGSGVLRELLCCKFAASEGSFAEMGGAPTAGGQERSRTLVVL